MLALKKPAALIAITGMLTTPLAMAQGDETKSDDNDRGAAGVENQSQGPSAGLQRATGLSGTQLAIAGGVLAVGIAVVASDGGSSSSSGTN